MSFSEYAAALNHSEPVRKSFRLDREAVRRRMEETIRREEYLDERREMRTRKVVLGLRSVRRSGMKMVQLERVDLMALRLNEVGNGLLFYFSLFLLCFSRLRS